MIVKMCILEEFESGCGNFEIATVSNPVCFGRDKHAPEL